MAMLQALLDVLGPTVRPLTGDAGLDVEIGEIVLIGPGDPLPDSPSALLVCVDHEHLLDQPVKAAGVVIKWDGSREAAWSTAPWPVLAADVSMPWNHLLQLLSTAMSGAGGVGMG